MAGKSTKTRNTTSSSTRPSGPGSSPDQREKPNPADETMAQTTQAFRQELLTSLREDIGQIIKSEIRSVLEKEMEGFRADIKVVRSELQSYQNSVATELATIKGTTGDMEKCLSSCTDDIVTLQREVARLKAQSESLQDKCEDLESRSRRNNIRIVGVPESHDSSTGAVSALLQRAFSLTEAPVLDRSHRALLPAPRQGDRPRVIVARMHYFQDCANILRLAREKQQIKLDGMTISVYPDYTARIARARAGYNGVRQQLRGLEGVRFGILYPARLRITHNNQERIFTTPEEAQTYINKNFTARETTSNK
uniref:L1 transposable element RRM domain-containing protein n=1 Tax=Sparus aurata TaxID=8175 RepID=A0A671TXN8_SPAAU